jgi:glutamine amidotransferase
MTSVTVIDYGVGNILSVSRALEHSGASVTVSSDPKTISQAERLVLPGVGAFGDCVAELNSRHLDEAILSFTASLRPMLGICIGMQILFEGSTEFGAHTGLGLLPGFVVEIPKQTETGSERRVPHIGWATLEKRTNHDILSEIQTGDAVYFVHSFHAEPTSDQSIIATTNYDGFDICAAVAKDNVLGCQFHPEKSGPVGLRILDGFLRL